MSVKVPSGFSLREGERPIWYGRRSFKSVIGYIIVGLVLLFFGGGLAAVGGAATGFGVLLILIAIILFIIAPLQVVATEYFITNLRTYVKYGLVSRRVIEVQNEWITDASVSQSFFGRALNYGNVVISTPGRAWGAVAMIGVSDPMRVKQVINDVLDRNKKVKEIEERIREIEHEHELGRITDEKYRELKSKYEEELKKYM
ncbi:MAG: PH domain-containing protein [Acidilobus sp.]|nr:PH domain-containing protein [Acidilobus sp.]